MRTKTHLTKHNGRQTTEQETANIAAFNSINVVVCFTFAMCVYSYVNMDAKLKFNRFGCVCVCVCSLFYVYSKCYRFTYNFRLLLLLCSIPAYINNGKCNL